MNLVKITKILKQVGEVLAEDYPSGKEYIIVVANMIRTFVVEPLATDSRYDNLNIDNANLVELAYSADPNNPYLALLLQSHVLLKISEAL